LAAVADGEMVPVSPVAAETFSASKSSEWPVLYEGGPATAWYKRIGREWGLHSTCTAAVRLATQHPAKRIACLGLG